MVDRFQDLARIVLEDGYELQRWSEYSINSDFLTPTDGWSFTFGDQAIPDAVLERIRTDYKVKIFVGDTLQLTGWIDKVDKKSSASGGTIINVQGRDILKPLCKAHIHPDIRFKDRSVLQLIEAVLRLYYFPPPDVIYDSAANVKLIQGGGGQVVTQAMVDEAKAKAKALADESARAAAASKFSMIADAAKEAQKNAQKLSELKDSVASTAKKKIDYVQPHPNEGAFEFLARNLRRFGLWMWPAADGTIIVSKPNYKQPASYWIQRSKGDQSSSVLEASYVHDRTNIPSQISVRGKASQGAAFEKATVKGYIRDTNARDKDYFEPFYMQHDQATTSEGAAAFAVQELSHLKQNERVYECTVAGHRDIRTGNIYAIDTEALVLDEYLGVAELMWVCSRTFRRTASGGTTTQLKLLPEGAIIFSDADATDMAKKRKKK